MQFIDLHAQQKRLKADIDAGIAAVLESGQYVMGPQVGKFETALADFGDARFALGCANGTDAITLSLMALGVGPGDAVFCPSFTFCATAEVVALVGATPVFVDIDRDTYNMDAASLETAIAQVRREGELVPKAVIVVDLFGQSADYPALAPVAREAGLGIIADSAQGFGTRLDGKVPLEWSDIQTTSFFPAKPLGAYGDGGAVLSNDEELTNTVDSLRIHGKGADKYDNIRIGLNSRLDTLQAAILLPKLAVFGDEIDRRNTIAARYSAGLRDVASRVPHVMEGALSTWAQYTIEVPDPLGFADALKAEGIPTARYYPKPIHMQTAYSHYPVSGNGLPNTMDCAKTVISLPMHAYLEEADQDRIIKAAVAALH